MPIKNNKVIRTTARIKKAPAKIAALSKNIGKSISIIPHDIKKLATR